MLPSLAHALHAALLDAPDSEALVLISTDGRQHITRAEINAHARDVAHHLLANNIQPGDAIIVLIDHTYEAVPLFIGALYMGAVPLLLQFPAPYATPAQQAERLAGMVSFFQPKLLVTVPRLQQELSALGLAAPIVTWDCAAVDVTAVPAVTLSTRGGDDLAFLQFTSGTTGQPKAVMVSHHTVLAMYAGSSIRYEFTSADIAALTLPLFHASGIAGAVLHVLSVGIRTFIIPPSMWAQQPALLLRLIHEERVTYSVLNTTGLSLTMLRATPEELTGIDLSCLRVLVVSTEVVVPQILEAFAQRFAPYQFDPNVYKVCYGASETFVSFQGIDDPWRVDTVSLTALTNDKVAVPIASDSPNSPDAPDVRRITACGKPMPGVTVEIRDETGRALPERHLGEIVAHTPALFKGYWRNPELTATVLKDGWYHTGDLGYMADDRVYVIGRLKDLIIVGGRNLLPDAIEEQARLATQPPPRTVVAFGVRNEALGTEQAVVVCEMAAAMDEAARAAAAQAVRTRVRQMLDVALGDVRFVEAGWCVHAGIKLARNACRDKYMAEFRAAEPAMPDPAASLTEQVTAIFAEILGHKPSDVHANFFDEGADSIGALELLLQVEKHFGRSLPQEFFRQPTVETLVRLLERDEKPPGDTAAQPATGKRIPSAPKPPEEHKRPWDIQRARHILRWRAEALAFRRSYYDGMRQLAAWCGSSAVQRLLYPREVALFQRFWASLHGNTPLDPDALTCSLMGNALLRRSFRFGQSNDLQTSLHAMQHARLRLFRGLAAAISAADQPVRQSMLTVEGADGLTRALDAGQGVIIVSYHATTRLAGLAPLLHRPVPHYWLGLRTYRGILRDTYGVLSSQELSRHWAAVRAQATQQAREVLQQGGIVAMTVDDIDDTSPIRAQIGTQTHPLITGFAELALATGAAVIPTYTTLDVEGHLTQRILPALDPGHTQMGHAARVAHLATQAGDFLTDAWRQAPATLDWIMMAAHMELPTVQPTERPTEPLLDAA